MHVCVWGGGCRCVYVRTCERGGDCRCVYVCTCERGVAFFYPLAPAHTCLPPRNLDVSPTYHTLNPSTYTHGIHPDP